MLLDYMFCVWFFICVRLCAWCWAPSPLGAVAQPSYWVVTNPSHCAAAPATMKALLIIAYALAKITQPEKHHLVQAISAAACEVGLLLASSAF